MATVTDKKKPHEEFAEKLIGKLKEGSAPWQQEWKAGEYFSPINPVSGTVYRGINNIMLSDMDFADPRWMTFKQANDKGYKIKKGSKSVPVVYWQWTREEPLKDDFGKLILGDNGEPKVKIIDLDRPRVYRYSVFHSSQMLSQDGEELLPYQPENLNWQPHEKAEEILNNSGAAIFHDQRNGAVYKFSSDSIHLPPKEQFDNSGDYYNAALHELGHWAASKSRLNLGGDGVFGSESYAKEELRVEIASW